jgi:hypothetical protein
MFAPVLPQREAALSRGLASQYGEFCGKAKAGRLARAERRAYRSPG